MKREKSKLVAILLTVFLGPFGVFYAGWRAGATMLSIHLGIFLIAWMLIRSAGLHAEMTELTPDQVETLVFANSLLLINQGGLWLVDIVVALSIVNRHNARVATRWG